MSSIVQIVKTAVSNILIQLIPALSVQCIHNHNLCTNHKRGRRYGNPEHAKLPGNGRHIMHRSQHTSGHLPREITALHGFSESIRMRNRTLQAFGNGINVMPPVYLYVRPEILYLLMATVQRMHAVITGGNQKFAQRFSVGGIVSMSHLHQETTNRVRWCSTAYPKR